MCLLRIQFILQHFDDPMMILRLSLKTQRFFSKNMIPKGHTVDVWDDVKLAKSNFTKPSREGLVDKNIKSNNNINIMVKGLL